MIDLNRKHNEPEESLGMVLASLIPFLVIILALMAWRLG